MKNESDIFFTVEILIDVLKDLPLELPVLVSGVSFQHNSDQIAISLSYSIH